MEELDKCPFCGNQPDFRFTDLRLDDKRQGLWCTWQARCKECGITKWGTSHYVLKDTGEFEDIGHGRQTVIQDWNRRAE